MPSEHLPEPLRIAFIITGLGLGGAEKCVVELATRIDRKRFAPVVYSLLPPPTDEQALWCDRFRAAHVPVHFLDARSILSFPRVVWQLRNLLRRHAPDVIQTFLYHANLVGPLAGRLAGSAPIFTGLRVMEPKPWRRWWERAAMRLTRGSVFVSHSVRRAYRSTRGPRLISTIPNGIDTSSYQQAAPADLNAYLPAPDTPIVLSVGRLHQQKGFDWLLAQLPPVLKAVPHHFVIAGDGPQRAELQSQAAALGIASRVHFLGWRGDVPNLLRRADLFILTSRYEGMPNVVLESMAAGVPVLATRVAGVAELLGPAAPSWSVPWGDSTTWQRQLLRLLSEVELRSELGTALQLRAEQNFAIDTQVRRYERLWMAAISSPHTSAEPARCRD